MIDGTYHIQVETPLGRKRGKVVLRTNGSAGTADIDAPIIGKQHVKGQVDGNTFSAKGTFSVKFVGKVNYSLTSEVVGDVAQIHIKTNKGNFELTGTRA